MGVGLPFPVMSFVHTHSILGVGLTFPGRSFVHLHSILGAQDLATCFKHIGRGITSTFLFFVAMAITPHAAQQVESSSAVSCPTSFDLGHVIGARAIIGNTVGAQHMRKMYLIATGSKADDNYWSIMAKFEQKLLNEHETGCDGFHYTWATQRPNGETSYTQYTFYRLYPGCWIQKRQDTGTQRLVIGVEPVLTHACWIAT